MCNLAHKKCEGGATFHPLPSKVVPGGRGCRAGTLACLVPGTQTHSPGAEPRPGTAEPECAHAHRPPAAPQQMPHTRGTPRGTGLEQQDAQRALCQASCTKDLGQARAVASPEHRAGQASVRPNDTDTGTCLICS